MKKFDYLVVGAGMFGAVCAEQIRKKGKSVLVIEKREHVGGNCYTYDFDGTNINVHRYGTHIFHTSSKNTWEYINQFTEFNRYQHRVLTTYRDRVYVLPINLGTVNAFFGLNLKPREFADFIASKRENIATPSDLESKAVSLIGKELYEAFIKGYTIKQWQRDPKDLPADIITRLPVRSSYFDSYFDDIYQGIPVDGYTPIFERMLSGIEIKLGVDFLAERDYWTKQCETVVYTGPIDRYFGYIYGNLGWRSVRMETELLAIEDYQGTSVMNYADENVPYTRIHEFKHLHREKRHTPKATVVTKEYPAEINSDPYYPVNSPSDREILTRYHALAHQERHTVFGGRLAQYKYFDMNHAIEAALAAAAQLVKCP